MIRAASIFLATLALGACQRAKTDPGASAPSAGEASSGATPRGYHVEGRRIVDSRGETHVFRGVDRPSLEWSPTGEHLSEGDYRAMASWGANVVRISLCQDFWLRGARVHDPSYPATVATNVSWAEQAGLDVILVLHWSDGGSLATDKPGMRRMPDDNSAVFWKELAADFGRDPRVLFELYNEPHDVSWDTWRSGGDSGDGFHAVGMQTLHDVVRSTGAPNLILIGGLAYAYDLSGVPTHRIAGDDIVYVTHPYDHPDKQRDGWDRSFGFLTATDAVMATELGSFHCETTYDEAVVSYAEAHGMSWSAWAWYVGGCQFPSLLSDWSGTPSARGDAIRRALRRTK